MTPVAGRSAHVTTTIAASASPGSASAAIGHSLRATARSPQNGVLAGPFGKVPSEISLEDAQHSARLAILAVLSSLKVILGDLDRVSAWLLINGYINAEVGYRESTAVMNPCSQLIVERYGTDTGAHARTAIGAATVPLSLPVVISAEVEIAVAEP